MGEGSKEAGSGKQGFLARRISRRGAIKLGAKGAGAILAVRGGILTKDETTAKAAEMKRAAGGFLKGEESPGEVFEALVGKGPTFLHLVYPNLPSQDMDIAKREAFEAGQFLLDYDRILRTAQYEDLIRNNAKSQGVPEELLLGLVIAESGGDPKAVSDKGAKGLTQMMDEMAEKHGLQISGGDDDERFDPEKIVPPTARGLREEFERFGNWGLAFQAWHVGDGNLYKLLKLHVATAHGEELPDIKVEPDNDSPEAKAVADLEAERRKELYKDKIQAYGVTVYNIFKNPQVQEVSSGEAWENTDQYLPRIIGSAAMFEGNKTIVKS